MNSSLKSEVRRCRPLLGTFVEISAAGENGAKLARAVDAAFAVIERVHRSMSIHDPDSELARLNRKAATRPVTVSRELFQVLRRADRLASESGGAFDYTVAPTLARWEILPAELVRKKTCSWRDVLLLRGRKVYFLQPVALDLGGIAKGFAVDAAIRLLQRRQVANAMVNAGGDLRVFGAQPSAIHLRHPADPRQFAGKVSLRDSALATSSPGFTEKAFRGGRVSHLVNPLRQTAITGPISVSVHARECWLADALTKVVLNAPQRAQKLLARYSAEAFVLTA